MQRLDFFTTEGTKISTEVHRDILNNLTLCSPCLCGYKNLYANLLLTAKNTKDLRKEMQRLDFFTTEGTKISTEVHRDILNNLTLCSLCLCGYKNLYANLLLTAKNTKDLRKEMQRLDFFTTEGTKISTEVQRHTQQFNFVFSVSLWL